MFSEKTLREMFDRTNGHCHFCGDSLIFEKYAVNNSHDFDGAWEVDHVIQKGKGGRSNTHNCLPACVRCNRLRWHRKGKELRDVIFLGLIAKDEIRKKSQVGRSLEALHLKRVTLNKRRRRKKLK